MAGAQIKGSEYPILKIFSDDFVFEIPPYQRPYAWGPEQAEELLDDLLTAIGDADGRDVEDLEPYFLGSIVLIKKDNAPDADVVDGQQRLTTLTILLAALRAQAEGKRASELKDFIMEEGSSILNKPDRYRLTIRERDAGFFREHIQDGFDAEALRSLEVARLTDAERNIRDNALCYARRLQALSEAQRDRLARYLLTQCYLVVVSTPNFDAAYRIFSVLNDRGMNLSHTDILKADILGAIDEGERADYAEQWDDIEEVQGRDAFQELFGHIRTIYRKVKRQDTLVEEVRENVNPSAQPKHFIDEVLTPFADAFLTIRNARYESTQHADAINRWLRWLGRIDNSDWLPPAILYLTRHQDEPGRLLAFFKHLERLAAGMMMYRANVNQRIQRYAQLLTTIEERRDPFAEDSPIHLRPGEQRAVLEALSGDLYHAYRIRTYALLRLDEALSEGAATYDHDIITIEHVLPQNPPAGSEWTQWFPDAEERERYANRLGNLVLLTRRRNSQASNYDFATKKEKYFKTKGSVSAFAITTQVVSEDTWTPEVVERRQRDLLDTFRSVWQLEAAPAGEALMAAQNEQGASAAATGTATGPHQGPRKEVREAFWTELLDRAKERTDLHADISPSQYNWIGTSAGIGGLGLNYLIWKDQAAVELYIDRGQGKAEENAAIFDELMAHREAIEEAFGAPLDWQRLPDKRATRIRRIVARRGYRDGQWEKTHEAMVDGMVQLEHAVRPYLDALDLEKTSSSLDPEERDRLREQFWTELLEQSNARTDRFQDISPKQGRNLNASAGPGFRFKYAVNRHAGRASFIIDSDSRDANRQVFSRLKEDQAAVEDAVGQPLMWLDGEARRCALVYETEEGGYLDEADWPSVHAQMVDAMAALEEAVAERLDEINANVMGQSHEH